MTPAPGTTFRTLAALPPAAPRLAAAPAHSTPDTFKAE